jgi:hypothetical protein
MGLGEDGGKKRRDGPAGDLPHSQSFDSIIEKFFSTIFFTSEAG